MVKPFSFSGLRIVEVTDRQIDVHGGRFDASYYINSAQIPPSSTLIYKPLCGHGGVSVASRPAITKRIYVDNDGIPSLQPSQICDLDPIATNYLARSMHELCKDFEDWFLKHGQILLTCSGTIGDVTLVTQTLSGKCMSQNLIRINPVNLPPGYLYAFLKTKIGKSKVSGSQYGAVIQHIDPSHLENIDVPIADKEIADAINAAILRSFDLRDESNDLMALARKKLLESLGLPAIDELRKKRAGEFSQNFGVVNFEVSLGDRMDASHYVPISTVIEQLLPKHAPEVSIIGDARISKSVFLPGRFTRNYVEEGFGVPFIGGGEIGNLDPRSGKFLSTTTHGVRISDQLLVTENQILITRSGTIGRCNIVPKHWDGWAMSEHMIRIQPTTPSMAGYIYAWLSTEYGRELVRRFTYGAVIDEIDADHVAHVAIPLLAEHEIREIGSLVLDANEKRHQAFLLEEQAIKDFDAKVWGD